MSAKPMQKPGRPVKFNSFRELGEFLKAQSRWEEEARKTSPPQRRKPVEKSLATAQPGNSEMPRFESFRQLGEYLKKQIYETNNPVAAGKPANIRRAAAAFSSNGDPVWSGPADSAKKPAADKTGIPANKTGTIKTKTVSPEARNKAGNERLKKAGVGHVRLPGPSAGGGARPPYIEQNAAYGSDNSCYAPLPSRQIPAAVPPTAPQYAIVASPKPSDLDRFIANTLPRIGRAVGVGLQELILPDPSTYGLDNTMNAYCSVAIPASIASTPALGPLGLAPATPCAVYYGRQLYNAFQKGRKAY